MKPNILMIALVLAITTFSCTPENRVFEEHKDLSPDLQWNKADARTFNVDIQNTDIVYDFSIAFRYSNGYPFQVAKVKLVEKSPSGVETNLEYDLKVRQDNGEYIGEPGYDIWDSNHLVQPNKKYAEKGNYTYTLTQNMPDDPMHFAMEVGLVIDKKE